MSERGPTIQEMSSKCMAEDVRGHLGIHAGQLSIFFQYQPQKIEINSTLFPSEIYDFLNNIKITLESSDQMTSETFKAIINELKTTNNLSINVWKPIRIALTGHEHGPDIGRVAEILGNDICSLRINQFLETNAH